MRIAISFDAWYSVLSAVLGLPPATAYVEIESAQVHVRMGWAFRTRFARSAVVSASPLGIRPLSRGVHGLAGRWLVNGSGREILRIELRPAQRAYVLGVPVRLRELLVSVTDAAAVAGVLRQAA